VNKIINYISHNILSFIINKFIKHSNKFISILHTDEYEVLSNNGYKDFKGIGLTKKFKIYEIKTKNGCTLKCANDHIIIDNKGNEILTKNLKNNTLLNTTLGFSKVISIKEFNKYDNMYDLIDVNDSLYYTNGILSHNSTIYAVFLCYYVIFNDDKVAGLLANKGDVAREILMKMQTAFYNIPLWLKPGYVVWNKGSIELDNDSRIVTAGTRSDSFTGYALNLLILDEISKMAPNIIKPLFDSLLPTISSGITSQIIGVSTPKGEGFYKEMWFRALLNLKSNKLMKDIVKDFVPIEATYRDIPERNNKEWVDGEITKLGKDGFRQEHLGIFLAMSDILLDNDTISRLSAKTSINNKYLTKKLKKYMESISVYYSPKKNHKYVIGFDPSEMNSKSKVGDNDNIGIQIIDVTDIRKKFKQVLTVNFVKEFNYLDSTLILYALGTYYNNALIVGENNIGKQILNDLRTDYEYDNIYSEQVEKYGYRLTKSNKPVIAKVVKFLIENNILEINDNDTINEFKTFSKQLKAMATYTDGLITSLFASIYFMIWKKNKIENLIGGESDGVFIKTGKELLKLSLDDEIEEDKELSDIIIHSNEDDELVHEILKENGFLDDVEEIEYDVMF